MIQRLQQKRNEEGFTLIELLIVIIVLGILAAIVVFAVGSTRKDSVASSCKTNFKAAELSAEAVNTKMGVYPVTQAELVAPTGGVATNGALLKSWPSGGTDYTLTYAPTYAVAATPPPNGYTITVSGTGLTTGTTAAACG
jgi:prepilin-type N-terminal cleavage/methylation domain-containing protein